MSELPEPTPADLEHVAALLGALGDEPLPPAVATRLSVALDAEPDPRPRRPRAAGAARSASGCRASSCPSPPRP